MYWERINLVFLTFFFKKKHHFFSINLPKKKEKMDGLCSANDMLEEEVDDGMCGHRIP